MCRVQDVVLAPKTGEEQGHAAQGHHADGISGEGQRHESAQAAHPTNILFFVATMNDRTGTHEQQGFEKGVGDKMENTDRYAADSQA